MYGVSHTTGVAEAPVARRAETRDPRTEQPSAPTRDTLALSNEARQAAAAARIVESSLQGEQIRAERVAEAKKNIEEGTYRVQEAVLRVALRLSASIS